MIFIFIVINDQIPIFANDQCTSDYIQLRFTNISEDLLNEAKLRVILC